MRHAGVHSHLARKVGSSIRRVAAHHVPVAVLYPRDDLLEEVASLVLHKTPLLHNIVKQLPRLLQRPCQCPGALELHRTIPAKQLRRMIAAMQYAGSIQWQSCGRKHLDKLHDDVNVIVCLYDLIEADDVRVHEQAQNLDLPPHCAGKCPVRAGPEQLLMQGVSCRCRHCSAQTIQRA